MRGDPGKAGAVGVVLGHPDHPGRWDYPTSAFEAPIIQLETSDFAALGVRLAAGAPATVCPPPTMRTSTAPTPRRPPGTSR
ncbi:hypothetical protein ACIQFZ_23210 [Streptomyces sp. NPDC093064]|uniref:hypothetical protein n=1 Tax=Streptomyces sp. NPDC093064 TaxID=3366020 RepID=UPI0037F5E250